LIASLNCFTEDWNFIMSAVLASALLISVITLPGLFRIGAISMKSLLLQRFEKEEIIWCKV
jgi:hypothetical protein